MPARSLVLPLALLLACRPEAEPAPPAPAPTAPKATNVPGGAGASTDAPDAEPGATASQEPETAPEPAPIDPLAPPSDALAQAFRGGAEDTLSPTSEHYLKSNESRHDVWFPYIEGIGGAYVGVGADQNYTVLTTARSEWVFLLDIDPRVALTHRAYEILVEQSETPDALLERFAPDQKNASSKLLEEAMADSPDSDRRAVVQNFRGARETLFRHLERVRARTRTDIPSTWLSDPERYAWLRRLFLSDRVRIMAGDLTGPSSMKSIGAAAQALGARVRVLYLSNAEEYFKYVSGDYRANVNALPSDERSVVLRTIYGDRWEHADSLWNYQVQPLAHFQGQLVDSGPRSRNRMLDEAASGGDLLRTAEVKGLSLVGTPRAVESTEISP
jgi:hypothetical protein